MTSEIDEKLLAVLISRLQGADSADYTLISRSATGLASYTARIARLPNEPEDGWLARITSMRDKMDNLQGRVTRGEALEAIQATRRRFGKAAQDRDREKALAEARAEGITISEEQ